jgi:hypothetical protein
MGPLARWKPKTPHALETKRAPYTLETKNGPL